MNDTELGEVRSRKVSNPYSLIANKYTQDTSLPKMSEYQQALLTRWVSRSADIDGGIPSRSDFPPNRFGRLMSHAIILDVLREPLDFHFRLFGTVIREYNRQDYTGKNLSGVIKRSPGSKRWKQLETVVDKKEPLYDTLSYIGPSVSIRSVTVLLVPLATDHQNIDKIFQVTQFIERHPITLDSSF